MDINAGAVLEGDTLQDVAGEIVGLILRVLEGEQTKAEINRQDGILCPYIYRDPLFLRQRRRLRRCSPPPMRPSTNKSEGPEPWWNRPRVG